MSSTYENITTDPATTTTDPATTTTDPATTTTDPATTTTDPATTTTTTDPSTTTKDPSTTTTDPATTTTTTTPLDPNYIHSENYDSITSQINGMLSNNQQAHISIYNDSALTNSATDSNGNPISDYIITSVSVTKSYIDTVTNLPVNANIRFMFNNGASFKSADNEDHWFNLKGVDFPIRTFF